MAKYSERLVFLQDVRSSLKIVSVCDLRSWQPDWDSLFKSTEEVIEASMATLKS